MAPGHEESSENSGNRHKALLDMQIYGLSMGHMGGGMLLDDQDNEGNTPLALAAREGQTEVVKLLLWAWRDGGDLLPSRHNKEGGTPLGQAAFRGHMGVVRAMVEAGVDAGHDGGDKFGFRPIQLAAQNGHTEVVRWLEERGCTWPPPDEGEGEAEGAVERQVERRLLARARGAPEESEEGGVMVEEITEGDSELSEGGGLAPVELADSSDEFQPGQEEEGREPAPGAGAEVEALQAWRERAARQQAEGSSGAGGGE